MIKGKVIVEGLDTMDPLRLVAGIEMVIIKVTSELSIIDKEFTEPIPIACSMSDNETGERIVKFQIDTKSFDKNISGDKNEFTIELLKSIFGGKVMYSFVDNYIEREDEVSFYVVYDTLYTDKTDLYEYSAGLMEYEYITTRGGELITRLNGESDSGSVQKHASNFKETVEYMGLYVESYKNNLEDLLYGIIRENLSNHCLVKAKSINGDTISFDVKITL